MARASGGANNMRPLSWGGGGTNGKDPRKVITEVPILNFGLYGLYPTEFFQRTEFRASRNLFEGRVTY